VAALVTPALAGVNPPSVPVVEVDGTNYFEIPDNSTHIGCVFQIDFYNFPQGNLTASVTFDGQPPTGGGTLASDDVPIGADGQGGDDDLDGSVTFDLADALADITPDPVQGHHVQLAIQVEGSIDAEGKDLWIQGCTAAVPTTTTTQPTPVPPEAPPAQPVPGRPTTTG
jgi:hypothetical protein